MSKKPLADDRRRELATEAFAKIVRAAFKGESDKAHEALGAVSYTHLTLPTSDLV